MRTLARSLKDPNNLLLFRCKAPPLPRIGCF